MQISQKVTSWLNQMHTEASYKVISSGLQKTIPTAKKMLTKRMDYERESGWISIGDVVAIGKTIDGYYSVVQIMSKAVEGLPHPTREGIGRWNVKPS